MSLVGTRPPTVDEWDKYELHHRARLATKPGLTGMWQVSGRSNITDFEEVVKLDDNGIKLINGNGEKMDEATINLVEAYLDSELEVFGRKYEEIPFAHKNAIGCTVDYAAGRNRYMGYLISLGLYSFKGMKVGLDCANGSSWNMAQQIFDSLGAKTFVINAEPDGTNINRDAGSTHIEGLQKYVVENGLDVGFAYDGDADRCLCVDEKGNVVDGDAILYIYGRYMKEVSCLPIQL